MLGKKKDANFVEQSNEMNKENKSGRYWIIKTLKKHKKLQELLNLCSTSAWLLVSWDMVPEMLFDFTYQTLKMQIHFCGA